MKRLLLLQTLLLFTTISFGQTSPLDKSIRVLQQVIDDSRNEFRHIRSKSTSPGVFESNLILPAAVSSNIKISADQKHAEWICFFKLYDDKQKAEAEFRQLSNSMSNAIIKVTGEQPFILNRTSSQCEKKEQIQCSLFRLLPNIGSAAKTSVLLSIVQINGKYRVELVVNG